MQLHRSVTRSLAHSEAYLLIGQPVPLVGFKYSRHPITHSHYPSTRRVQSKRENSEHLPSSLPHSLAPSLRRESVAVANQYTSPNTILRSYLITLYIYHNNFNSGSYICHTK
jgi:hypothetical protein